MLHPFQNAPECLNVSTIDPIHDGWVADVSDERKWKHYYTGTGPLELTPIPCKKLATPLSVAVAAGNQDIVEMLRAQGAVSDPQNASTPLVLRWCA